MKILFVLLTAFISNAAFADQSSGSCEATVYKSPDKANVKIDGDYKIFNGYQIEASSMVNTKTEKEYLRIFIIDKHGEFAKTLSQVTVSKPKSGESIEITSDTDDGGYVVLKCTI